MNLSEDKLKTSVIRLKDKLNSKNLDKFLNIKVSCRNEISNFTCCSWRFHFFNQKQEFKSQDIDELIELLQELSIRDAGNAAYIRNYFSYLLLPIASLIISDEPKNIVEYQRKFVALSIFAEKSSQILRLYFHSLLL